MHEPYEPDDASRFVGQKLGVPVVDPEGLAVEPPDFGDAQGGVDPGSVDLAGAHVNLDRQVRDRPVGGPGEFDPRVDQHLVSGG